MRSCLHLIYYLWVPCFVFQREYFSKIRERGVQKEGEQDKGEGSSTRVQLRKRKRINRERMREFELR